MIFQDNARMAPIFTHYMLLTHTNYWPCLQLRTAGPQFLSALFKVLVLPTFVFWEVGQERNTVAEGSMNVERANTGEQKGVWKGDKGKKIDKNKSFSLRFQRILP
jgi:hypothetical protein